MAINSQSVLYSPGKNDECLTPAYGVQPILKYIPPGAIVWCPFDKPSSNFVKLIRPTNTVICSHIDDGRDFYVYEPAVYDVIISNPPFTNKRGIFSRALALGKPFALLMANTWLNDAAPVQLFVDTQLQLLMFDKRIKFETNGVTENKITFSSSYYCHEFLPRDLILEKLKVF